MVPEIFLGLQKEKRQKGEEKKEERRKERKKRKKEKGKEGKRKEKENLKENVKSKPRIKRFQRKKKMRTYKIKINEKIDCHSRAVMLAIYSVLSGNLCLLF